MADTSQPTPSTSMDPLADTPDLAVASLFSHVRTAADYKNLCLASRCTARIGTRVRTIDRFLQRMHAAPISNLLLLSRNTLLERREDIWTRKSSRVKIPPVRMALSARVCLYPKFVIPLQLLGWFFMHAKARYVQQLIYNSVDPLESRCDVMDCMVRIVTRRPDVLSSDPNCASNAILFRKVVNMMCIKSARTLRRYWNGVVPELHFTHARKIVILDRFQTAIPDCFAKNGMGLTEYAALWNFMHDCGVCQRFTPRHDLEFDSGGGFGVAACHLFADDIPTSDLDTR